MVKLIYSPIASLDGHVEDEQGTFDWAAPDDEVHAFVNELERPIGTYLYGRRMYETMVFWETVSGGADQPAVIRDFAEIWRAAEKTVFSRTLQTVASARTHMSAPSTPTRFGASRKPREPTSRSEVPNLPGRRSPGPGRPVTAVPRADHCWWRQARTARRHPHPARATTQTGQRCASARTAARMLSEMTASSGRSTIGVSVPS